jgi:hypothetical protein
MAIAAFASVFIVARYLLTSVDIPSSEKGNHPAIAPGLPLSPDELFSRSSPAVMQVVVQDGYGRTSGRGSGFLIRSAGLVATNYHVIEKAHKAHLVLADGTEMPVLGVVAYDETTDLAIIRAAGPIAAQPLPLAGGDLPPVGTKVYAIGNPLGLSNTLSDGLVSGHRELGRITQIQTTAPISPGSSGGPLLTAEGTVIGVTTFLLRGGQNLNFAIPVSQIKRLLDLKHIGALSPRPLTSFPLVREPNASAYDGLARDGQPTERQADRQSRNQARVKLILGAIEELDPKIRFISYKDNWRRLTNPFRVNKMPAEWDRDQLVQLLVEMEMNELGERQLIEKYARKEGVSPQEWRRRRDYPMPEDHKSGAWKRLRDELTALEYR